jgi:hypothetical protein
MMTLSTYSVGGYRYLNYFSDITHMASVLMCHVPVFTTTISTPTMQAGITVIV